MKFAVWQDDLNRSEGEPRYHTLKLETVEDLVHAPMSATVIDAENHGEALDLFIERKGAADTCTCDPGYGFAKCPIHDAEHKGDVEERNS